MMPPTCAVLIPEERMQALDGIRIVDLSTGVAGAYCTKLLADYGAEVIKVEPPGGDPVRHMPPFAGDVPHPERSLAFLHLNTNKRSVTLNPYTSDGIKLLLGLSERSQVVIEDWDPGVASELGLGYAQLSAGRRDLVYASITPWGQSGPYVDLGLRASDIVLQGMGGPVNMTGKAEREPLKLAGNLASMQAGLVAAWSVVMTTLRVEAGGEGDHIDVSIYETQMGSRDRRTTALTAYAYQGTTSARRPLGVALGSGAQPCADGYINISAVGPKIVAFMQMIGREDLVGDPRLMQPVAMLDPAFVEEVDAAYLTWSMARGKHEAVAEAQRYGLLSGVMNTPADLIEDPEFAMRGVWDEIEHPVAGTFRYPGRPVLMGETPRATPVRAPLLGEHTAEVLTDLLGVAAEDLPVLRGLGAI